MSDIFREVEEDVRRERFQKFLQRHGALLIGGVVLILAGVGGWKYWEAQEAKARVQLGEAFVAAQRISDPKQSAAAFDEIAKNAKGGYGLLARMSKANALYATGQLKASVDLYREIAAQDQDEIGNVARLRAAWIIANTAPRKEIEDLLAPLNKADSAWQPMAHEVLAFADYRASRIPEAAKAFRALSENARAPEALRNRARAMAEFLENGAGGAFGTVPETPDAPAAPLPGAAIPLPAPAAQ